MRRRRTVVSTGQHMTPPLPAMPERGPCTTLARWPDDRPTCGDIAAFTRNRIGIVSIGEAGTIGCGVHHRTDVRLVGTLVELLWVLTHSVHVNQRPLIIARSGGC